MYNSLWNEKTEKIDLRDMDYIVRFPYFVYQISRISKHLEREEINQALRKVRILIDGTCMYVLKKAYGTQPKDTYYFLICDEFEKQGEESIPLFLKDLHGSLSIAYDCGGVEEDDVIDLVQRFDFLLRIVTKRYPQVVDDLESGVEKYFK